MRHLFISITVLSVLATISLGNAQENIYVIQHSEVEIVDTEKKLSEAGLLRAASWAEVLKKAELEVVVFSKAPETRETSEVISKALGIPAKEVPGKDVNKLIELLAKEHAEQNVLIVTDADMIPSLLEELGLEEEMETNDNDTADLFLVVPSEVEEEPYIINIRMP